MIEDSISDSDSPRTVKVDVTGPEDSPPVASIEPSGKGSRPEAWMQNLEEYFKKGLFILLSLFIALAAFSLYFSIEGIIARWVQTQYEPIVAAVYYIGIIVLGLYLMKTYIIKR